MRSATVLRTSSRFATAIPEWKSSLVSQLRYHRLFSQAAGVDPDAAAVSRDRARTSRSSTCCRSWAKAERRGFSWPRTFRLGASKSP